MNLLYLASSLEKAGFDTEVVDLSYKTGSLEECAKYIISFNPKFIGVSIHFTFLVNKSLRLMSLIKRLDPKVKIIVGGAHFTALPEQTMYECPEPVRFQLNER